MKNLNFRNVLITGGTSGIGKAFAYSLPESTNIMLLGRNATAAKKIQNDLSSESRHVEFFEVDLTSQGQIKKFLEKTSNSKIDLIIHAAGRGYFGSVTDDAYENQLEIIELNCVAPILLTKGLLDRLERGAGIIFITSVVGFMPMPYLATYAASKSAVQNYAEALSEELRGKLKVMIVSPGATNTAFTQRSGLHPSLTHNAAGPEEIVRQTWDNYYHKELLVIGKENKKRILLSKIYPRKIFNKKMGDLIKSAIKKSDQLKGME